SRGDPAPARVALALRALGLPRGAGRGPVGAGRVSGAADGGRLTGAVRVALVGLGAIGREVLKAVRARPSLELSGAFDPAFVGRDAGEVAEIGPVGVKVASTLAGALAGADVAL